MLTVAILIFLCSDDTAATLRARRSTLPLIFLTEVELLLIHGAQVGEHEGENLVWSSCLFI
jgi:hypothetical protein